MLESWCPHAVLQGRELSGADIGQVQGFLAEHPEWGRTRLSEEFRRRWDWRNALGRPKDMAARTLPLKLERSGHILPPPRQGPSSNEFRNRRGPVVTPATEPIHGLLPDPRPLAVSIAAPAAADRRLFDGLLAGCHYLGHRNTVGENLGYLVRDRMDRPVVCARCSARRRGSARTETPISAGIPSRGSATCNG